MRERVLAATVVSLAAPPAMAGCNSGNVGDTSLLGDPTCQASAPGSQATAVGGGANAPSSQTTAVGAFAGFNSVDPNNARNTFIGATAGIDVAGQQNTATGVDAMFNVLGDNNSAYGYLTGQNVTGANNTAVGAFSGSFVNGFTNTATGAGSGGGVTGSSNSAYGDRRRQRRIRWLPYGDRRRQWRQCGQRRRAQLAQYGGWHVERLQRER